MTGFATDLHSIYFFLQAGRLPLSKCSPPTSQNEVSGKDSFFIALYLDTLSWWNERTEAPGDGSFPEAYKHAVTGHSCSVQVHLSHDHLQAKGLCSCLLCTLRAGVALTDRAPGCSSKAGAININDFTPHPHSAVPGRPTVPPTPALMLLRSAVWDAPHSLAISLSNHAPALQNKFRAWLPARQMTWFIRPRGKS